MKLRDAAQELIELGPRGTAFRLTWEMKVRTGLTATAPKGEFRTTGPREWIHRLQLEDPTTVARYLHRVSRPRALDILKERADAASEGRILCFGRWTADFGNPIDWHCSPVTGGRWNANAPWYKALAAEGAGDVKYVWEAARFPHAYHLARAATVFPELGEAYASALLQQINGFIAANSPGFGVHWASGQEIGFRLLAWLFALDVLLSRSSVALESERVIAESLLVGAAHIEEHLDYARIAVYNNHLLSEALALFAVGALLPDTSRALRWREVGRRILDQQAERQFYSDGGYIQQSHNYHRVALQDYLWACVFARAMGDAPSPVWLLALERSLDFLIAQQNPFDGRLPNYGSNDGALPSIFTTCDFSDMRPVLQAVSLLTRGERVYDRGPWDETAAWCLGVRSLDAPIRASRRTSVSFAETGYHALRGSDESSFATFRCGTLRDRFSQIDMLHLDLWWRGENVLVDPGSYQYNAAPKWHDHFMRTSAHNTITIDGENQMVHHRQFKVLYWTKARLTRFEDHQQWALCAGEQYGYRRLPGQCLHHREVLFLKDDLWVVVDSISGEGAHDVRLHWLGGDYPWTEVAQRNGMDLRTPAGVFSIRTFDAQGATLEGDVRAGDDETPRGWLSRYYGEKVPVPSFATTLKTELPAVVVSVLSGVPFEAAVDRGRWRIETPTAAVVFELAAGTITQLVVDPE